MTFPVPPGLLEASLDSLRVWYSKVSAQRARHVFSLLPVLTKAPGARQLEYFERDDEAFLDAYLRIPGATYEHPFFDPFSSEWLPRSYAHSNMATFRKRTFFPSWGAGSWVQERLELNDSFADIFARQALAKGGDIHRIPAWPIVVWLAAVAPLNGVGPSLPDSLPDTATEAGRLLQAILGLTDSEWAQIFDDSIAGDEAYERWINVDGAITAVELLDLCSRAAPTPRDLGAIRAQLSTNERSSAASLEELASRLFLSTSAVEDMSWLLKDRGALVLTGPPGVGKTHVARELAGYLAGERVWRVQFHPAYSYEYFVTGYRPRLSGGGEVGYEVVAGPLVQAIRAAAADEEEPVVLLIDEINRANVGAVFGELLSAMEYRGDSVKLQYPPESGEDELVVPPNLYILGTMNQSDRSAVNFDAALRRRFAFFECSPMSGHFEGVLREYLSAKFENGRYDWIAEWISAINIALPDQDFAIGGSYFFGRDDLGPRAVQRIFDYEILPYISGAFDQGVVDDVLALTKSYFSGVPVADGQHGAD